MPPCPPVAMTRLCSTCAFWIVLDRGDAPETALCVSEGNYVHQDNLCDWWYPRPVPEIPESICSSNKVCFTNRLAAVFALVKLEQVSTRERIPRRAYLCPECKQHHLTSMPLNGEKN